MIPHTFMENLTKLYIRIKSSKEKFQMHRRGDYSAYMKSRGGGVRRIPIKEEFYGVLKKERVNDF